MAAINKEGGRGALALFDGVRAVLMNDGPLKSALGADGRILDKRGAEQPCVVVEGVATTPMSGGEWHVIKVHAWATTTRQAQVIAAAILQALDEAKSADMLLKSGFQLTGFRCGGSTISSNPGQYVAEAIVSFEATTIPAVKDTT